MPREVNREALVVAPPDSDGVYGALVPEGRVLVDVAYHAALGDEWLHGAAGRAEDRRRRKALEAPDAAPRKERRP